MNPWREVIDCVEAHDLEGLAEVLAGLNDLGRKAVAGHLPAYLRDRLTGDWEARWQVRDRAAGFRLAGAACLPGAAQVATWLNRRELRRVDRPDDDAARILAAIAFRPEPWRADLAARLVEQLRPARGGRAFTAIPGWDLAVALLADTGIEPPRNDALVAGWAWRMHNNRGEELPFVDEMVPRLFEAQGVAAALSRSESAIAWLVRLADEGRVKRADLLDGCHGRFLVGGDDREVAPFVSLWRRLGVQPAEIPARDFVRLLPTAATSLAALAADELRRVPDLDHALYTEAVRALAFRPENKLVTLAVRWMGERGADLPALATVLSHDTPALRDRAVRLAVRHAPQASEHERELVREAAVTLPVQVRERLAAVFGPVEALAQDGQDSTGPVATPLPALPPPIASVEELVDELSTAHWDGDPMLYERILAALVAFAHADREALAEGLRGWLGGGHHYYSDDYYASTVVRRAAAVIASPDIRQGDESGMEEYWPGLHRFVVRRLREVVELLQSGGSRPVLLATPTEPTGHVDPATLLARLELLGQAEPLPTDLLQALLRLPRAVDPALAERAERLGTPAGRQVAAWLRRWPFDPEVTCAIRRIDHGHWHEYRLKAAITLPAGLPGEVARLWTVDETSRYPYGCSWWPAIMPSHREVVAAHLLPSAQTTRWGAGVLAALVQGEGPVEGALAGAVAFVMGHNKPAQRAEALDALITLAARGELEADFGQVLAVLIRNDLVTLSRVTAVLAEALASGVRLWPLVEAALPLLLPRQGERARAGLGAFLTVAADAAALSGATGEIPGLAEVAARPGASRLAEEARRLHLSLYVETSAA